MTTDLELIPTIRSKPISLKVLANQRVIINHELGRIPAGWLVIDSNRVVNVWRSGLMDKKAIELIADQNADITLVLL